MERSDILTEHYKTKYSVPHESFIGRRFMIRLQQKDPDSMAHCLRVAELARRFSTVLGSSPSVVSIIYQTAMVHDIGKIGIPDDVLKYPGRLNQYQWEKMRAHCVDGTKIIDHIHEKYGNEIAPDAYFRVVRSGVLYHHERWDGLGYPSGMRRREIPYVARIISLCDAADAMLSDRIYRKALSEEYCRYEIATNAGTMFDPDLARSFIENWETVIGGIYHY